MFIFRGIKRSKSNFEVKKNYKKDSLVIVNLVFFKYKNDVSERILKLVGWLVGLFGFYGISTFVGYVTPNPFLYK